MGCLDLTTLLVRSHVFRFGIKILGFLKQKQAQPAIHERLGDSATARVAGLVRLLMSKMQSQLFIEPSSLGPLQSRRCCCIHLKSDCCKLKLFLVRLGSIAADFCYRPQFDLGWEVGRSVGRCQPGQ